MIEYKPWPHIVEMDNEIASALPSLYPYLQYDIAIVGEYEKELFIELNGEKWRKCAELVLAKYKAKNSGVRN